MITMVIGGLWHGAYWTFVVWGGLHGTGLAFERARARHRSRSLVSSVAAPTTATGGTVDVVAPPDEVAVRAGGQGWARARRIGAWAATFNFVCLGWIFFRATSFANAVDVLRQIFSTGSHVPLKGMVVLIVVVALAVQWFPARYSQRLQLAFSTWSIYVQALAMAGVLVVIDAFGPAGVPPFIYYRF